MSTVLKPTLFILFNIAVTKSIIIRKIIRINLRKMAIIIEPHVLNGLIKRLNKAENTVKTLSEELISIKKVVVSMQIEGDISNNNALQFHSESQDKKRSRLSSTSSATDGFDGDFNNGADASSSKKPKPGFTMEEDYVVVYTDGACENNGRPNAKAGIGVWFGENHPANISEPVKGRATNNTAEIQACIEAIRVAIDNGIDKLKIKTDSQFTIDCMTKWIMKWKVNNWKLASGGDVKNKEDLIKLDYFRECMGDVQFEYVRGHKGIKGNEAADSLAVAGARRYVKEL